MVLRKRTQEKLGEILLRQGAISKHQLEQALECQKTEGGLLGEIMIKLGYVSDREIAKAIISQYEFPYIPLENYDFNPEAAKLIPENVARQYRLVPLDVVGDVLVIAMSNPLNRSAIEDIELIASKKVQVFLAIITSINEALNKVYEKKKK